MIGARRPRAYFVHVGKSAGSSVWEGLQRSSIVTREFRQLKRYHVRTVRWDPRGKYIFIVRDPVERLVSAFEWRRELLLNRREQRDRFPGELEVLKRWGSVEEVAENLYSDGILVKTVSDDFSSVHHVLQGYSWYLDPILPRLKTRNVFAILSYAQLNDDLERFFRVSLREKLRSNNVPSRQALEGMSSLAQDNLNLWAQGDKRTITALWEVARGARGTEAGH